MPKVSPKRLLLVDSFGVLYQQFHAVKYPMSTRSGIPTAGLFGYCRLLMNSLEYLAPTHVACVLEGGGHSNHRLKLLSKYKSTRSEPVEDLRSQFQFMIPVADALGISSIKKTNYEADDVIAALAKIAIQSEGFESVVVLSNDKDLLQLVCGETQEPDTIAPKRNPEPYIRICKPKLISIRNFSEESIGPSEVRKSLGITPEQVVDYLSLVGDSSDNIPGVPSIGPARAKKLLNEYQNLDKMFSVANDPESKFVLSAKLRQAIIDHEETALLNRKLIRLADDINLDEELQLLEAEDLTSNILGNAEETTDIISSEVGERALLSSLRCGRGRTKPDAENIMTSMIEEFEFNTLLPAVERIMGVADAKGWYAR
eukprot:CAMPEP_0184497692 /NCGR_PEP_ID=MMETSP0113_2-20130426/37222_1 /TAXON_ID=91329 /ORGANISM="Norrisiella sphaerica, Strain BC52" /LENGTH=370 /DNA_ID=CAMNT_0026884915 /DNA_START=258 /DNA_END=1370 /DNA_ORIENTATION=+